MVSGRYGLSGDPARCSNEPRPADEVTSSNATPGAACADGGGGRTVGSRGDPWADASSHSANSARRPSGIVRSIPAGTFRRDGLPQPDPRVIQGAVARRPAVGQRASQPLRRMRDAAFALHARCRMTSCGLSSRDPPSGPKRLAEEEPAFAWIAVTGSSMGPRAPRVRTGDAACARGHGACKRSLRASALGSPGCTLRRASKLATAPVTSPKARWALAAFK